MPRTTKPVNGSVDAPKPARTPRKKGNGAAAPPISSEEIRRKAYEIYERRGRQDGADLDDWLKAEREVKPDSNPVTGPAPAKPKKRKASEQTGL